MGCPFSSRDDGQLHPTISQLMSKFFHVVINFSSGMVPLPTLPSSYHGLWTIVFVAVRSVDKEFNSEV